MLLKKTQFVYFRSTLCLIYYKIYRFFFQEIQRQILNEFKQTMRDSEHQEDKQRQVFFYVYHGELMNLFCFVVCPNFRFQYLHQKLSHIKRLVNEFDSSITNGKTIEQENY